MRLRDVPYTHAAIALALGLALGACKGCGPGGSERPIRFVSKDADAVLEIRDLGMLAKSKKDLQTTLAPVIPPDQFGAIEQELTLSLGFNPTTEQGLEEAGLPKEGPIAVQLTGGGRSALWIVPVKDQSKLEKTIDKVARARASVESTEKVNNVTVLKSSFGPEKVVVAAYAFHQGLALIGAGSDAQAQVEQALALKDNISAHPEYAAVEKALPQAWDARIIMPSASTGAGAAMQTLSQLGGPVSRALSALPEVKGVKSAGWAANFEKRALEVNGRIRVDDASLAKLKSAFTTSGPAPVGVRAVSLEDAVAYAYLAANVKGVLTDLLPPGSPARAELDRAFEKIKRDIGTDVETEVLPLLSGHGAAAVGMRNLSGLDLRKIAENPAVLWVMFALGSNDPAKLFEIEKRMDEHLIARKLNVAMRKSGEVDVHSVTRSEAADKPAETIVESMTLGGARVFSTEAPYTDRAVKLAATPPADPLDSKAGAYLELRFSALSKALAALDMGQLPIMYRVIAAKVMELLRLLDRASVSIQAADDGMAIKGRVQLVPASP